MLCGTVSFVLCSIENEFYGQILLEVPYTLYYPLGDSQSTLKSLSILQEKNCLPLFNLFPKLICSWRSCLS